ncbi:MAG: hypothetical protein MPW15_13825 [Candidatus Manganitrophus sp.]|nr:hypothetical protein [Candidatus Manganitrophus sp.]
MEGVSCTSGISGTSERASETTGVTISGFGGVSSCGRGDAAACRFATVRVGAGVASAAGAPGPGGGGGAGGTGKSDVMERSSSATMRGGGSTVKV